MAVLASESLDALGCQVPFFLDPILDELKRGTIRYDDPLMALGDLVSRASGRGDGGSSGSDGGEDGGGGGGATATTRKSSTTGGGVRLQVRYDAHLPALSLRDGENSCSILAGTVLPALQGTVICKI